VQINTEGGCHLTSAQVLAAVRELAIDGLDILFIENVGNLVCPAEFDVGEDHKITLLSVTEGDDKPEKYPLMFNISSALVLNKVDLLPYVEFNLERAGAFAKKLNNALKVFPGSCRTGAGVSAWYDWRRAARAAKKR
jgi:hydrogenase nickel incorporation protein HypB